MKEILGFSGATKQAILIQIITLLSMVRMLEMILGIESLLGIFLLHLPRSLNQLLEPGVLVEPP